MSENLSNINQTLRRLPHAEAAFLKQLNYWVNNSDCGVIIDGKRWIYNSYDKWAEQLGFSKMTTRRAVSSLRKRGLIQTAQLDPNPRNRTFYYSLPSSSEKTAPSSSKDKFDFREELGKIEDELNKISDEPKTEPIEASLDQLSDEELEQMFEHMDGLLEDHSAECLDGHKSEHTDDHLNDHKSEHMNEHKDEHLYIQEHIQDQTQEHKQDNKSDKSNESDIHSDFQITEGKKQLPSSPSLSTHVGENPVTVQLLLQVWNKEFSNLKTTLNKELARALMAAYKIKFSQDIDQWRNYLRLVKTSPYLISPKFRLSLRWLLKFETIDRLMAGDLGVDKSALPSPFENPKLAITEEINSLDESPRCRDTRLKISAVLPPAVYEAWFGGVKMYESDDGCLVIETPGTFNRDYICANFRHALSQIEGQFRVTASSAD